MSKALAIKQAKRLLSQIGFTPDSYSTNINGGCIIDVKLVASKLGINLLESELPDDVSGVFFKKNKQLYIAYNRNQSANRQQFTIAHEIGHYILHASDSLHYDNEVFYRANDVSNSEEIEANRFAAELLMPDVLIIKCIDSGIKYVNELANMFGVSDEAMRYRLINLGYL